MIHIGAKEITKIYIGSNENPTIHVGNFKTWPTGVITTEVKNVQVVYSSGNMLNAAGTNYATVQGTYITYIDGVESSRQTVTLTPRISTQVSWLSVSDLDNTHVVGEYRDDVVGDERSATITASYNDFSTGVTISQQANVSSVQPGAITGFTINGDSSSTIVTDGNGKTLGVSVSGYNIISYTSGAEWQRSIQTYTFIWDPSGQNWATANTNNGKITGITISEFSSSTDETRAATIKVMDSSYPSSVFAERRIVQQTLGLWDITFPSSLTIDSTATAFTFNFTVKKLSQPFTSVTVSNFEISPVANSSYDASDIVIQSVTHNGGGAYTAAFTCSANTSEYDNISSIKLNIGQNPKTCVLTQSCASFEGIDVKARSSDKEWALGVLTNSTGTAQGQSYNINGIILACKHPVTSETTINVYQLTWGYYGSDPQTDATRSKTISAGATVTIGTKVYYGAWLETPRRDLYVSSVSQIIVS